MPVPEAFAHMVHCFHQDVDLLGWSKDELISHMFGCLHGHQKAEVRAYLDQLLAQNPTGAELRQLWLDADPDWYFRDGKNCASSSA